MSDDLDGGAKGPTPRPEIEPVVLVSWAGGFAPARLSITPRRLCIELGFFPDNNGRMGWAVRCFKERGDVNPTSEFQWCLWLPFRTETAAKMAFEDILAMNSHKLAMRAAERRKQPRFPQPTESQMRFLAKSYPRTIALMRQAHLGSTPEEAKQHHKALRQAYVEETFACSGVLMEPATDGKQVLRMARLFQKMSRRKRKTDPVEFELIIGCHAKGYCRMKLEDLREAVAKAVGYRPTIDAIRQKWKRLGLPSERRRGRQKTSPPK